MLSEQGLHLNFRTTDFYSSSLSWGIPGAEQSNPGQIPLFYIQRHLALISSHRDKMFHVAECSLGSCVQERFSGPVTTAPINIQSSESV